jgi:hypothetical protein
MFPGYANRCSQMGVVVSKGYGELNGNRNKRDKFRARTAS